MEATLTTLANRIGEVHKKAQGDPGSIRNMLLGDDYIKALIQFISLQMTVLVIDPKLYRREAIWTILELGLAPILRGYVQP